MALVYQHRRKDTNEVFYIGIGRTKKRAFKFGRNPYWNNIASKGYDVDILIEGISWEQAQEVEIGMIQSYGRLDRGTGILANMTDGGEGGTGVIVKPETIEKIRSFQLSLNKKGQPGRKKEQEEIDKIRATLTGRPRPLEVIEKLKKPKKNKENYSYPKAKVQCPHCDVSTQASLAYRWHFDNCKNKK
jgi:hypothetical protein